jgi:hypothetical protein
LDIFWLQATYCPISIIPAGSGHFCIHSIYSLFAAILTGSATDAGRRSPIAQVIQLARARNVPVVVFPEGRPTNGGGLVRSAEVDASDADMTSWDSRIDLTARRQTLSQETGSRTRFTKCPVEIKQ